MTTFLNCMATMLGIADGMTYEVTRLSNMESLVHLFIKAGAIFVLQTKECEGQN